MENGNLKKLRFAVLAWLALAGGSAWADQVNGLALTSFYRGNGRLCLVDLANGSRRESFPIHTDAVVRQWGDYLYVLNRRGMGSLQVYSLRTKQRLTGRSFREMGKTSAEQAILSNPQDIVALDEHTALVSFLEAGFLIALNPMDRAQPVHRIDLTKYADADGSPEATRMLLRRDRDEIVLQLQRLDRRGEGQWLPHGDSKLIFLTPHSYDIQDEKTITLPGANPLGDIKRGPGGKYYLAFTGVTHRAVVATGKSQEYLDGGIHVLDPQTLKPLETVLLEKPLGGELVDVTFFGERAFAVVVTSEYRTLNDATFSTRLVEFDPKSGRPIRTLAQSDGASYQVFQKIGVANGQLLLAEANAQGGRVRTFGLGGPGDATAELPSVISSGLLRPYDMALLVQ